jgi:uncharacterized repeat protein (TIGR02543 family)
MARSSSHGAGLLANAWLLVAAFMVAACGSGGSSGGTEDVTRPTSPSLVTVSSVASGSIRIVWDASTDDTGVIGYRVYRDGVVRATLGAVTSMTDSGLPDSTRYCYSVTALDAAGNESIPSSQGCATTPDGGSTEYTLTVTKSGTGNGTVAGTGIDCGADCSEPYPSGSSATLTATAAAGSTFGGWTGCSMASGSNCIVAMTADKTATATFNLSTVPSYTLAVARNGTGSGTVTGTGISCGTDCSEAYPQGTNATLTATPAAGSTFAGWTGCTTSSGASCTVAMTGDKTATATFNLNPICTPAATRCVGGNIEVQEKCNAAGSAWVQEACGAWRLCASATCRVACGMTTAPANPTVCLVPISDGVNNGEWTYWTDSRLGYPTYVLARSQTGSGGYAPIYGESGETWPYSWNISSQDLVGVQFRLDQFGYSKHPSLGYRAKRSGIVTGYVNNFLIGIFASGTTLGSCTTTAGLAWSANTCNVGTPMNQQFNYAGAWNSMLLSITGDGFGGAIDLMDVNYVYLTIAP